MPARSTSKTRTTATKAPARKPVVKKKASAASKAKPATRTKPVARKKSASKPKPGTRKAAPARRTLAAKAASKGATKPGTISVGDTEYVLGEYGMLMNKDEYERMMAKKASG